MFEDRRLIKEVCGILSLVPLIIKTGADPIFKGDNSVIASQGRI